MSRNRDPEPTEDRPIERDEDDSLTPDPSGEEVEEGQRVRGQQAPGATSPPIPGIDPAEARGLVGRKRRIEEEGEDELDESEDRKSTRPDLVPAEEGALPCER